MKKIQTSILMQWGQRHMNRVTSAIMRVSIRTPKLGLKGREMLFASKL